MSGTPLQRRSGLAPLVVTALVLGGMLVLLARGARSWTAWLVTAGALANFMVALLLWRARNARR